MILLTVRMSMHTWQEWTHLYSFKEEPYLYFQKNTINMFFVSVYLLLEAEGSLLGQ